MNGNNPEDWPDVPYKSSGRKEIERLNAALRAALDSQKMLADYEESERIRLHVDSLIKGLED